MKKLVALVLASIMMLSMFTMATAETAYKDTLVYAVGSDQNTLDPAMNTSNQLVLSQVYGTLFKKDAEGKLYGDLATDWVVGEDGLSIAFTLREGVTFHNGKAFTANDVKASYDRILADPNTFTNSAVFANVTEIEVIDDLHVTLHLSVPDGSLMSNLAAIACTYICDADYIAQYEPGVLGTTPETTNGTGPYKLSYWEMNEEMRLEANESFYGDIPLTKNIVFKIISDQASRAIAVETGEVDIAGAVSPADFQRLQGTEGLNCIASLGNGMVLFYFNCTRGICVNTNVRKAIHHAVDIETLVSSLYGALGEKPCYSTVAPNSVGYKNNGRIPYDVETAKQMFEEAGVLGDTLKIMTYGGYNQGVQAAEVIAQYLREAGMNAEVTVAEEAVFVDTVIVNPPTENPYDLYICGAGAAALDADETRLGYADPTSPDSHNGYNNPKVSELLNATTQTMDQEERQKLFEEAIYIMFIEDPACLWIQQRNNVFITTDKVENFSASQIGVVDFSHITVAE